MKTRKHIVSLSAALIVFSSATAFADSQLMKFMGNNPVEITFCNTEQAAAQLGLATNTGPIAERPVAIEKTKTEFNYRSEIQEKEYILYRLDFAIPEGSNIPYQILDIIYQPGNKHKFIAGITVGEYTYMDICQANELIGQVNRFESDKDGRLYLKKYMVTSTCVNGKNKAAWKPLN